MELARAYNNLADPSEPEGKKLLHRATTNIEKVLINNWTNVIELKMSFLVVKM